MKVRLVWLLAWETLLPVIIFLPVTWQIRLMAYLDHRLSPIARVISAPRRRVGGAARDSDRKNTLRQRAGIAFPGPGPRGRCAASRELSGIKVTGSRT